MLARILVSSFIALVSWSTLQADENLALLSSTNTIMSRYGMVWQNPQILLRVKSLTDDKSVRITFTDENGQSFESEAAFVGPAEPGYEIWEGFASLNTGEPYSFVVTSTQGEQTFVDDNGGQGYRLKQGPILYQDQAIQQILGSRQFRGSYAYFLVGLRNIAYQKNVQVHYSFDGFQTVQTAGMNFQPSYSYGYGSIASPTADGFEIWSLSLADVPHDASEISYYFTYEVDNKRYVDSNFGNNYSMIRAP